MRVLNEDYKATGPTFESAEITRTYNADLFIDVLDKEPRDAAMKNTLRRGDAATLDVYTVSFACKPDWRLLGYATFPKDYAFSPTRGGVVINYSTLPGGIYVRFNKGGTLTHEVGHWLRPYHTFQGLSCEGPGDYINDTPAEAEAAYVATPVRIGQGKIVRAVHLFISDLFCSSRFIPSHPQLHGLHQRRVRGQFHPGTGRPHQDPNQVPPWNRSRSMTVQFPVRSNPLISCPFQTVY